MNMFKQILLPVKSAETLDDQLALVSRIADDSSEVRVLHVTPVEVFSRGRFNIETADEASHAVEAALVQLRKMGISAHGAVGRAFVDRVGQEISIDAISWVPDVVVLGRSTHTSPARWVSGSIASTLERMGSFPVLVAPLPQTVLVEHETVAATETAQKVSA
jgi:nucleotide-binding universal stress UspA family protein